jgi:hypothetical protein
LILRLVRAFGLSQQNRGDYRRQRSADRPAAAIFLFNGAKPRFIIDFRALLQEKGARKAPKA